MVDFVIPDYAQLDYVILDYVNLECVILHYAILHYAILHYTIHVDIDNLSFLMTNTSHSMRLICIFIGTKVVV